MKITKTAIAGTLESSDILVEIAPADKGLDISLESVVYAQFSEKIISTAKQVLDEMHVTDAHVALKDHGALDCVIRARIETAINRASTEDIK